MSKAKRLMRGSVLGVTETILTTIVSLFMMPFSIYHLGDRMYGLWLLVGNFSGYYGLFDFGLASAVQRYWSRALGTKDYEKANKIFNSSLAYFSLIGFVVFIASLGVAALAPLFFKNVEEIVLFKKIIIVVGFGLGVGFPMRTFWASYAVHFKNDLHSCISMAQLIIRNLLIVILLLRGHKLLVFTTVIIATDICAYLVLSILSFKIATYIKLDRRYIKIAQIKEMFGYSVFSFIGNIADNINAASDNFVITGFIGLQSVTMYSIAGRLRSYYRQVMYRVIGAIMPLFSILEAQNNYDEIRHRFWFFTKISGYCACLIAGILIIFGKPFIICWMGSKYSFAYTILLILTASSIINLSQIPAGQLLLGISKHKFMAFINLGTSLFNLILSILLAPKYGLVGVALGSCIASLVGKLIILPVYVSKQLSVSIRKYSLHYFRIFAISFLVLFIETIFMFKYIQSNYFSLGLWGSISSLVFCVIIFFFGFDHKEQGYLSKAFKGIFQIKIKEESL